MCEASGSELYADELRRGIPVEIHTMDFRDYMFKP